ncbi:MAG TPA: hypothetical protein VHL11_18080 [Phototrophicaceae bacterium]|nr:hypothetical protein [Phototrophicaceae bacterium]
MLDDTTMQIMLNELLELYSNPDTDAVEVYLKKMHPLAEAKYVPAKAFFVTCLDDKRWDWRYDSLSALGLHYDLSNDDEIKDKLRYMLLNDEDDTIRSVAAASLGRCTIWAEKALFASLQTEPDRTVREDVFLALMLQGGMPFSMYIETAKKLRNGEIEPNLIELKNFLQLLKLSPRFPSDV